jgi:hypothetical protein
VEDKTHMDLLDKETLARMFGDIFTTCTALSDEALARYAELEMAGQAPRELLPQAGAHLDECPDCAGRYAELLTLLQAEMRGDVPSVPHGSPFDLQFLSAPGPDLWIEMKETFYRLVAEIPIVIQRTVAAFGPLPTPLVPCRVAVAAGAARDVVEMTARIESLRIPDESASLVFTLTPGPVDADQVGITLVLKVEDLQSGRPLEQVRVNLCDSQAQLLQSKTTAADGQVVFRGLAGDYVLRCRHAGRMWDFPVRMASATSFGDGG